MIYFIWKVNKKTSSHLYATKINSGKKCPILTTSGFGLIEVLISATVLSIGLLGLAALQATTIKMNQGAAFRSQADQLVYEITDAMRANREAAFKGQYDLAYEKLPDGSGIAYSDLVTWRAQVQATLPDGTSAISVINEIARVSVRWDASAEAEQSQVAEFIAETRL